MSSNLVITNSNASRNRYMVIRAISMFTMQMVSVVVAWQIYDITKSAFYLGLVGLIQFLPMLALTLVVGMVSDRVNRKLILSVCQTVAGVCFALLAAANIFGWINKEVILGIIFLLGVSNAFQGPAMQSILPNIVSKEEFPKATALAASLSQAAVIVGPSLGGIIYTFSVSGVYIISAVCVFAASFITIFIRTSPVQTTREPVTIKTMLAGISFIRSKPIVLGAISLDLFAVLFGGATALLPIYAQNILNVGSVGLGALRSAPAIGALLVSFYLSRKPLRHNVGYKMFAAVAVFGLSTLGFAVSHWFILSFVMLMILGSSDVISVVIRTTLVQISTPDEVRGRVSSVNMLFINASNQLGEFESGLTASWFGAMPAAIIGGIGTLLVVALWMIMFPQLKHADKLVQSEE